MPAPHPRPNLLELLAKQAYGEVLAATSSMSGATVRDPISWYARARAALAVGQLRVADDAATRALALGGADPDLFLARAIIDHRLGQSDAAIHRLRGLLAAKPHNAVDANMVLAEVLHRAHRADELNTLMSAGGAWLADERAVLFSARVIAATDPQAAAALLETCARGQGSSVLRRITGFEAVKMLDTQGEYKRAYDLAVLVHATTGSNFDVDGMLMDAQAQRRLLARGKPWFTPRAPAVQGIALVVGMPRSGTTLLEHMLDRHPQISGIGEYDGVHTLGNALQSADAWPAELGELNPIAGQQMQQAYLQGARVTQRAGTQWAFDKSLHTWRWLPAVAAVLPGAVCFHIMRDPRDTAISLFLSNFHPKNFGWTRSIADIGRVIAAERQLAPEAMQALAMPHESIIYEELVDQPAAHMQRCLQRLKLEVVHAVLEPEANRRTVLTLSHEQVRRPINRSSIGRWRNYPWAFDGSWDHMRSQVTI